MAKGQKKSNKEIRKPKAAQVKARELQPIPKHETGHAVPAGPNR